MTDSDTSHAEGGAGEPEAEVDLLIGMVIADRYRVDEKLGVGGMGAVYRAEHVLMRKPVAVKVLHREMTTVKDIVKRFELEAIAAGRIDHPNVTVATDFGKLEDGAFYLVLEYVPGRSLTDVIRDEAPLPVERTLFIARQVAGGLGAAHAAGIVHRDLKPDNIMLIERGGTRDFVKVLDFGIAKVTAESGGGGAQLTRVGAVFGTPAYMAPEQAAGKRVDHRADLYSLGLVIYEMLTGQQAFQSPEIIGLLTKQLTESIDADVRALVMKLLEKDPEARVGTAEELVAAIDQRLGSAALPPDSTALGIPSPRSAPGPLPAPVSARSAVFGPTMPTPAPGSLPLEPARRALAVATDRLSALAARAVGGENIRVFGRDVPLWLAGAASGAVIMGTVLTLSLMRPSTSVAPAAHHAVATVPPAKDMDPVIARAAASDHAAMAELVAIPEKDRSAPVWMGLARGHAGLAEYKAALHAYRRAVLLDASLAKDVTMLRAVRRAVDDAETQKVALDLAAGPLGASGADILFDVSTTKAPPKSEVQQLAKTLLERDEVKSHMSKALGIALALRRTSRCEEAKRLLPQAIENADERSVRPLTAFSSRGGCGFLSLSDCFSCLRRGDDLPSALAAAQSRKAPKY
jgi:serine/threonine-protein kinase